MFNYNLKPYELFGYPFFFGLLAVIIARAFPSPEMNVFLWAFEINVALVGVFYLLSESTKYVDARTSDNKTDERPLRAHDTMPKIKEGEMLIHSQVINKIRFDASRNCARVWLGEWEHHGEIDATETTWLEPRINTVDPRRKLPKRWQGKDSEFRKCKQDWEQSGILGRENPDNKKSRFIVRDPERLRQIAAGRL